MDKRDEILEIIKKRLLNVPLHEEKRIVLAVDCVDKLVGHLMEWHEKEVRKLENQIQSLKGIPCIPMWPAKKDISNHKRYPNIKEAEQQGYDKGFNHAVYMCEKNHVNNMIIKDREMKESLAPLRKVWGNLSENDIIYLPTPLKEAIQQVLGETEEGGE